MRLLRVCLLLAVSVGALAGLASSATATWTNTGDTAFTAAGGPVTITGGSSTLTCSFSTLTGTAGTSAPYSTWFNAFTGRIQYTGCRVAGLPTALTCVYSFDAYLYSSNVTYGSLNLNAPNGCTVAATTCRINVSVSGTRYTNPLYPSTVAWFAIPSNTSTTLSGTNCILGSGAASMTTQMFSVTAASGGGTFHMGPFLTRF